MMRSAAGPRLLSDMALGAAGCGLATLSAGFGFYMMINGPPSSFGKSKDFTVFAQLAPRAKRSVPRTSVSQFLDMTATASIPEKSRPGSAALPGDKQILPSIVIESADGDEATIAVGGQPLVVHVGDIVPGAGEVLTITPGAHPEVRTSRGVILAVGTK